MKKADDIQLAKEYREFENNERHYADDRSNRISDSFRGVELQIAALVFAFNAVFIGNNVFQDSSSLVSRIFAISLLLLAMSLLFGLLNEYMKINFWKNMSSLYSKSFRKFDQAVNIKISLKEALAFHNGQMGGVETKRFEHNQIFFVLQTISLVLGLLANLSVVLILFF